MSSVRSKGGRADIALGRSLWQMGLRYRRKSRLIGKPDLVFPSARVVVFVDGDFWHGRWLDERIQRGDFKSNADYWIPKLRRNIERDQQVTERLTGDGWLVLRVWESDVKKDISGVAERIAKTIRNRRGKLGQAEEQSQA